MQKAFTKTKILPKAEKNQFFNTFLIRIWIEKSIHQNQNLAKSWKNKIFNTFLIRIWIEKNIHQNQDLAKSWKNQFFNTFLIRIWIEKSIHQNQDLAKSWKNQFFNTFLIRIWGGRGGGNILCIFFIFLLHKNWKNGYSMYPAVIIYIYIRVYIGPCPRPVTVQKWFFL